MQQFEYVAYVYAACWFKSSWKPHLLNNGYVHLRLRSARSMTPTNDAVFLFAYIMVAAAICFVSVVGTFEGLYVFSLWVSHILRLVVVVLQFFFFGLAEKMRTWYCTDNELC